MPASIGVNLRVTGHCRQGGRKYMEDFFSVAYQQTEDERDLEYAFFGIYDGHGGAEAAAFAKERLMETIVRHKSFWSDNDEDVLRAIKMGYIATHYAMWKEQEKWPKTTSGLPSTAGTTASIAFIRRGKIYVGHVGDSGIVLGYQDPDSLEWKAKRLTRDHKPECASEMTRIVQCGGKVISKSGVPRVVWNRPRIGHKGPVRRSTPIDEIPFLAVARSLGDLWSYNSELDEFVVSPDPDCSVIPIDTTTFRCLIFGTDGLYNMLSPQMAVRVVQQAEKHNEDAALSDATTKIWLNPSKCLVERALELWSTTKMRADNTSVVTLMLDPPGPPRAQVLKNRKKTYPDSGLSIVTRYQDESVSSRDFSSSPVNSNVMGETGDSDDSSTSLEQVCQMMERSKKVSSSVAEVGNKTYETINKSEQAYENIENQRKGFGEFYGYSSSNLTKARSEPLIQCQRSQSDSWWTVSRQSNVLPSRLVRSESWCTSSDENAGLCKLKPLGFAENADSTLNNRSFLSNASSSFSNDTSSECCSCSIKNQKGKSHEENIQINEISSSSNESLDVLNENNDSGLNHKQKEVVLGKLKNLKKRKLEDNTDYFIDGNTIGRDVRDVKRHRHRENADLKFNLRSSNQTKSVKVFDTGNKLTQVKSQLSKDHKWKSDNNKTKDSLVHSLFDDGILSNNKNGQKRRRKPISANKTRILKFEDPSHSSSSSYDEISNLCNTKHEMNSLFQIHTRSYKSKLISTIKTLKKLRAEELKEVGKKKFSEKLTSKSLKGKHLQCVDKFKKINRQEKENVHEIDLKEKTLQPKSISKLLRKLSVKKPKHFETEIRLRASTIAKSYIRKLRKQRCVGIK